MTKQKKYWLASAAVLTSVAGAQAADLPFRKAAPVDYVRVCDAFGEGFFYIPGTDTCLRVNGAMRAEYTVRGGAPTENAAAFAYNQAGQVYRRDLTSFRARGYLNADARNQTAYGTLRTYVSFRITQDSTAPGPFGGRGEVNTGAAQLLPGVPNGTRVSTGSFQGYAPNSAYTSLDKGFIQFAGLTAGRAQSFFDFDAQSYEILGNSIGNSNQITEMFAYTATFGGGFSATISVEDRNERAIGDNGAFVFGGTALGTAPGLPTNVGTGSINNPSANRASVLAYAGETIPDIVGNLRYDASWGSAQLSGAYHEVRSMPLDLFNGATNPTTSRGITVSPKADGFAVLGGVKVLLPMLAKGDNLTLQGTYVDGALDYINPVNYLANGITNVYANTTTGVPSQFGIPVNDAFVLPNGRIGLSHAAGGFAAFRHYFVPTVYGSLFGSYVDISTPLTAQRLGPSYDSARVWQIGGNVVWSPVKDFQIGGEVLYTNLLYKNLAGGINSVNGGAGFGTTPTNPDDIRGRLTVRRAF